MAAASTGPQAQRHASLRMSATEKGHLLTAHVPVDCSEAEFARVAGAAYGLVHKLTGCNCLSGRIRFVVEDIFTDVINVNLG